MSLPNRSVTYWSNPHFLIFLTSGALWRSGLSASARVPQMSKN